MTVPADLLARFEHQNPAKLRNFLCALSVLANPSNIYLNTRQLNTGWIGVSGRPEFRYDIDGGSQEFPEDRVYAVYYNAAFVVHEWGFERMDETGVDHIENWKQRFGDLVWTRHNNP